MHPDDDMGNTVRGVAPTQVLLDDVKHPTEVKYPVQCEAFKGMIDEMYQIHLDKNRDYSPANIVVIGQVGIVVRVWDKFCRICNLYGIPFPAIKPELTSAKERILEDIKKVMFTVDDNTPIFAELDSLYGRIEDEFKTLEAKCEFNFTKFGERSAANEPLVDAWKDLANYAVIGFLHYQGKWGR